MVDDTGSPGLHNVKFPLGFVNPLLFLSVESLRCFYRRGKTATQLMQDR